MQGKLLVTVDEAAQTLSLGKTKVYEMISSGKISSLTIGRRRLIPSASLAAFVREQAEEAIAK